MPDRLIHGPVLVNTIGHCAGVLIFGILCYLFIVSWRRAREERSILPTLAAGLAMLWNAGSLIALARGEGTDDATDIITTISFSALSLLPAVLLHISLGALQRALWTAGYVLGVVAIGLHVADLLTGSARFHSAALLLVTIGFGALTVISVIVDLRTSNRAAGQRLAGAMSLFLFAISFVHFGSEAPGRMWEGELAVHHAGLPLALLVLLQDYRFLLMDTFLRFIVNATLSAAALLLSIRALESPDLTEHFQHPFDMGVLFVAGCLLLTGFVYLRNRAQKLVTSVLFLRSNVDEPQEHLRNPPRGADANENDYLEHAASTIARFLHADRFTWHEQASASLATSESIGAPAAILNPSAWELPAWVQAMVPLSFARGDERILLLGARAGGRRYLSEDFTVLARLAAAAVEHVEQSRGEQMQQLVTQAELRALQSQINPHFLFNSLNTLYGTISRDNAEARRLVLNLSDIFRYFLQSDRTFIPVAEELKIVRAYLEIEQLRLGPKLRAHVEADPAALAAEIPVLSIQPLVENAVKHGVATRSGEGFVHLRIEAHEDRVVVAIFNSGDGKAFDRDAKNPSADRPDTHSGIGLANVRRRLTLCFGEEADIRITTDHETTEVGFSIPLRRSVAAPVVV
jgi:two-component system LytT family sensor kinase